MARRRKFLLGFGMIITAFSITLFAVRTIGNRRSKEYISLQEQAKEENQKEMGTPSEESIPLDNFSEEEEAELQEEQLFQTEEEKKIERKLARLEKLRKREAELESKESLTKKEKKELSNLPAKIQGIEMECGLYDYRAGIYSYIGTLRAVLSGIEKEMGRENVAEEMVADYQQRRSLLTSVCEKYEKIMEDAEQQKNVDYEAINQALLTDMDVVHAQLD